MSSIATTDPPNRAARIVRWIGVGVPVLLLIACVAAAGWFLFPVVFPQFWANHLSRVQGKVELIVPAQQQLDIGQLSPDGQWMVMRPIADSLLKREAVILNLVTGEQHQLALRFNQLAWLDSGQFIMQRDMDYALFSTDTMSITILKEPWPQNQYLRPGGFEIIKPWLSKAQKIYAVQRWGTEYTLFVQSGGHWNVVLLNAHEFGITIQELKDLVTATPHIDVPNYGWTTVNITGQRVYSPNGQLYVTREGANRIDVNEHAAIYGRDGQLVASAYKAGWAPYVLGWAHDGSGVYVQFAISGSAATMLVPYKPLFKLSPATIAEQRWQMAWTLGTWVVGIVVVGGLGWWLVVRRCVLRK